MRFFNSCSLSKAQTQPHSAKNTANGTAGTYLRKPGKYGYGKPVPKISPMAPSPAAREPPQTTISAPAIAKSESPVILPISQNNASPAKKAAIAPPAVIAVEAETPKILAGMAIEYGAAN